MASANVNTMVKTTPITARKTPTSKTNGVPTAITIDPAPIVVHSLNDGLSNVLFRM